MTTLRTTLGAQVVRATDGTWCFAGTVDYVGRSMQRHIVTLEKSGVQGYTYERYRLCTDLFLTLRTIFTNVCLRVS